VEADKVTKFSLGNTSTLNQAATHVVKFCFFLPLPNRLCFCSGLYDVYLSISYQVQYVYSLLCFMTLLVGHHEEHPACKIE